VCLLNPNQLFPHSGKFNAKRDIKPVDEREKKHRKPSRVAKRKKNKKKKKMFHPSSALLLASRQYQSTSVCNPHTVQDPEVGSIISKGGGWLEMDPHSLHSHRSPGRCETRHSGRRRFEETWHVAQVYTADISRVVLIRGGEWSARAARVELAKLDSIQALGCMYVCNTTTTTPLAIADCLFADIYSST
jgi:hypothetical protein